MQAFHSKTTFLAREIDEFSFTLEQEREFISDFKPEYLKQIIALYIGFSKNCIKKRFRSVFSLEGWRDT
jgi:hypothetical protein